MFSSFITSKETAHLGIDCSKLKNKQLDVKEVLRHTGGTSKM